MAARVIHVGADTCHRLPVLENAGYQVHTCISVFELREALAASEEPEAVLISEKAEGAHPEAVLIARSCSSAPIILFRETQSTLAESSFDLVIPNLVPPQTWLAELAAVIARRRALGAIAKPSAAKRKSAEAGAKSSTPPVRPRKALERNPAPPKG